jgi:hypothetical protein
MTTTPAECIMLAAWVFAVAVALVAVFINQLLF